MHSFISVTVDNNSIFELSQELMIVIIVLSAVLVVTCAITVSSVCIVIIVKRKKEKRKWSVRRKPSWRKNARIKRGIPTHTVQPEPPVYIEILPDLKAPRSSASKSGGSHSDPQTPPISVPVRCTKSTNPSNVDKTSCVEDNTYVNIGLHRTATQTGVSKVSKPVPQPHQERITYRGDMSMSDSITIRKTKSAKILMSDAKSVPPPRLMRQNAIKEEEVCSQITSDIPLETNGLYDILQPREKEEEEEQEYIEMMSLTQDIQVNWNSAYRKLEMYNI